jgi:hypothetical protein
MRFLRSIQGKNEEKIRNRKLETIQRLTYWKANEKILE